MTQKIRTRFAPSPTGHLHIGNARTAIMNWIFARHSNGEFILRVEDTDRERSTAESEQSILGDLKWLGLDWDEGPDKGGSCGPYRQSERLDLYDHYLKELLSSGDVYPCYCTAEELEARREEQLAKGESPQYNGHCRHLSEAQIQAYKTEGRAFSYRFKAETENVTFRDLVRGEVTVPGEQIGDFIIARPDGMPMYNFGCVIDDHLMAISHVIRGDDHVSNTPRQVLIYRTLGWEPPIFAHIPMILGADRQRLSKRHGATSVDQYHEQGYLADALVNFLSLLSWSSETGDEVLSRERLIQEFDFKRITRSSAVFDIEKLNWMNGLYIRAMEPETLAKCLLPYSQSAGFPVQNAAELLPIARMVQEKMERLSEFAEKAKVFFQEAAVPENDAAREILAKESSKAVFGAFLDQTKTLSSLDRNSFMELMKTIQKETGVKGKDLWMPVRIALSGQEHGPDLPGMVEYFGLEKCRRLIQQAMKWI